MIVRFTNIFMIIFLSLCAEFSFTQVKFDIGHAEDSLKFLLIKIQNAENDSIRFILNERFEELFYQALSYTGSFDYPFDSLKTIAKLTSPDKKFRIYNWNIPKGDGSNIYYGYIQLNPKSKLTHTVYRLFDRSDSISQPELAILDHRSWFGSLYYKIIMTSYDNRKYYTLLGWDGLSQQLSQKIIEILWFDNQEQPYFGAKIFRNLGNDQLCRILFKYASTASMILTYDDQYLTKNKKWNASKKQFDSETEKTSMIVCDELIPIDPQLEGQYEYYIPSSEVYNGFVFKEGHWNFSRDVDVRNKSR